jgi:hypothetical protein
MGNVLPVITPLIGETHILTTVRQELQIVNPAITITNLRTILMSSAQPAITLPIGETHILTTMHPEQQTAFPVIVTIDPMNINKSNVQSAITLLSGAMLKEARMINQITINFNDD